MSKIVKKAHWTAVFYPESLPADWREQLQQRGMPFAVSPLHDKDVNPDGTPKKPHYHIILSYPGPTTYNNVLSLTEQLCQPIPKVLDSVKGMYRYFTHLDNPEKYQYDASGIKHYNGFNPLDYDTPTRSEVLAMKTQIIELIKIEDILEYSELLDYLLENDMVQLFDCASSQTILFNRYLTSKRERRQKTAAALSRSEIEAKAERIKKYRLETEQLDPLSQAAEDSQPLAAHIADEPF